MPIFKNADELEFAEETKQDKKAPKLNLTEDAADNEFEVIEAVFENPDDRKSLMASRMKHSQSIV